MQSRLRSLNGRGTGGATQSAAPAPLSAAHENPPGAL